VIVRLGIVAPRRSSRQFEAAAQTLSGMEPRWLLYDSERSVPAVVAKGIGDCDALCFSGYMPRERSDEVALPPDMPITVVRLTSVDVALCLLRAQELGKRVTPMSIDTAAPEIIAELVDQLGLDPDQVAHLAHSRDLDIDDIVAFHRDAHDRTGTTIAITGRSNAVAELEAQLNIPVIPAVPVVSSIRSAMNRAVLAAANRRQADKSFAAAVFRVVARGDLVESEARRLAMAHALHDIIDLSDAWVEARSGGHDVLVFGHRRLMQTLTHDWTAFPLAHDLEREVGHPIAIGIGLGGSARRSVEFAETALNRAVRAGGRCGYVLSDEGVVIGPLTGTVKATSHHRFRSEDADVTNLARELGFGIPTITRLLNYEHELRGTAVSAAELGRELMLSPQSGRRIARALDQHGLLIAAGASQAAGRGRPTNLFRLNLRARISNDASAPSTPQPATAAGDS
jgi:hypothetical protein